MRDMGIVQGSAAQAVPLVIGVDTVYVHTDIKKIEVDDGRNPADYLYEYYEHQFLYKKDDFSEVMLKASAIQEEYNAALRAELADAEEALNIIMGVQQ